MISLVTTVASRSSAAVWASSSVLVFMVITMFEASKRRRAAKPGMSFRGHNKDVRRDHLLKLLWDLVVLCGIHAESLIVFVHISLYKL